jgi:protein O-GlcNAc transferase
MATIAEALRLAQGHQEAGRLELAAEICRRILAVEPRQPEVLHLAGLVACQLGRHAEAVELVRRAIDVCPTVVDYHNTLGEALRLSGELAQAAACFRRALELNPAHAEAHNNLANTLHGQGDLEAAVSCFRRAIELKPELVQAHGNLGRTLHDLGRFAAAEACYRRALELRSYHAPTWNNLGIALRDQGRTDEAVACYERALALAPDYAEAHFNLGNARKEQGRLTEAIASYRQALRLNPDVAEVHTNLGAAWETQGQPVEAAACYQRVVDLRPHDPLAFYNLGAALFKQGRLDEAIASYRQALRLNPDAPESHNNLGTALAMKSQPVAAATCFQRALELKPDYVEAHNNLGNTWKDRARHEEALACFRRALALDPDYTPAHSNLVFTLLLCPDQDPHALGQALRAWAAQHAAPLATRIRPHGNDRNPDRRLRIGYVSPDFRQHVVGRNVLPLLREHDHTACEIFCYSGVMIPDAVTEQFRSYADHWRPCAGLNDTQLAAQIRADQIDILLDLSLHTAGNRLQVFAEKPAPVQVTWAGYPGSTGLSTIDYRLTDPYLDPPGADDAWYVEESVRLPHSFWCYEPPDDAGPVNALPALDRGYLTFGCLSNFCKVTRPMLRLWAQVLRRVADARLVLLADEGSHRDDVRALLAAEGVATDRVSFVPRQNRPEYLATYGSLDLGLDTFPYNGHSTSLDSLWMGVPVVTLVGQTAVARAGLSQLTNLGLAELVAQSPTEFVEISTALAHDLPRLAGLRAALRERMRASPLMDTPRFARDVEAAYRQMWRRWCEKPETNGQ